MKLLKRVGKPIRKVYVRINCIRYLNEDRVHYEIKKHAKLVVRIVTQSVTGTFHMESPNNHVTTNLCCISED